MILLSIIIVTLCGMEYVAKQEKNELLPCVVITVIDITFVVACIVIMVKVV